MPIDYKQIFKTKIVHQETEYYFFILDEFVYFFKYFWFFLEFSYIFWYNIFENKIQNYDWETECEMGSC